MASCHTFLYSALWIYEHWRLHKSLDFTGTARIMPDSFTTWLIDHCSGNIDPSCTVGLQQSLVYLADVASWLNMLCWIAVNTENYTKANDEIFPDTAKERQPSLLTYKWSTINFHQLSIWTLWLPTFPPCTAVKLQKWSYRHLCYEFQLTYNSEGSFPHPLERSMENHWWVKTSGSLLSLAIILIQTNGGVPISPSVNKGRHQTPLFSMALCSQSIFSPVDDIFFVSRMFN